MKNYFYFYKKLLIGLIIAQTIETNFENIITKNDNLIQRLKKQNIELIIIFKTLQKVQSFVNKYMIKRKIQSLRKKKI